MITTTRVTKTKKAPASSRDSMNTAANKMAARPRVIARIWSHFGERSRPRLGSGDSGSTRLDRAATAPPASASQTPGSVLTRPPDSIAMTTTVSRPAPAAPIAAVRAALFQPAIRAQRFNRARPSSGTANSTAPIRPSATKCHCSGEGAPQ